jgi:hypothetical protein
MPRRNKPAATARSLLKCYVAFRLYFLSQRGIGENMREGRFDTKAIIRMLPDLVKLGVVTKEGAAKLREAEAKGLLPKTCDGQRRLVRSIRESTEEKETQARVHKTRAVLNAKKAA